MLERMQAAEGAGVRTLFLRLRVAAANSVCRWFLRLRWTIGKLRRLLLPLPPGKKPAESATESRPHPTSLREIILVAAAGRAGVLAVSVVEMSLDSRPRGSPKQPFSVEFRADSTHPFSLTEAFSLDSAGNDCYHKSCREFHGGLATDVVACSASDRWPQAGQVRPVPTFLRKTQVQG